MVRAEDAGAAEVRAEYDAAIAPFVAAEDSTWNHMKAVYDAAKAQDFYCHSHHLGYNATRELILQNID